MKIKLSLIAAAMALTAGAAMAQSQGVSKNEIVLGSIQDLSGPLAGFGVTAHGGVLIGAGLVHGGRRRRGGKPIGAVFGRRGILGRRGAGRKGEQAGQGQGKRSDKAHSVSPQGDDGSVAQGGAGVGPGPRARLNGSASATIRASCRSLFHR